MYQKQIQNWPSADDNVTSTMLINAHMQWCIVGNKSEWRSEAACLNGASHLSRL